MLQLAATDPANPYGALMRWPAAPDAGSSLTRSVGARVILCDGALVAYLRRGNPNLQVFLPEEEPAAGAGGAGAGGVSGGAGAGMREGDEDVRGGRGC